MATDLARAVRAHIRDFYNHARKYTNLTLSEPFEIDGVSYTIHNIRVDSENWEIDITMKGDR